MIKNLLRKHISNYLINEAVAMSHFKERINEIVDDIQQISISPNMYLPNISKDKQDDWIIDQIKFNILNKITSIINKQYPIGQGANSGICVVIPLGLIKVKNLVGQLSDILITAKRKEGPISGKSYYITIYDNRIPTIVLADPKNASNSSPQKQLQAHIKNSERHSLPVNIKQSFVDSSFINTIIIDLSKFNH